MNDVSLEEDMGEAVRHASDPAATSDTQERIRQAVYEAIDEVNDSLDLLEPLDKSSATVLIGGEEVDSLALLTFATSLEENLHRTLGASISVIDLLAEETGSCTVGSLIERLQERLDSHGHG